MHIASKRDLELELEVEARFSKRLQEQINFERMSARRAQSTVWLVAGLMLIQTLVFAWLSRHLA